MKKYVTDFLRRGAMLALLMIPSWGIGNTLQDPARLVHPKDLVGRDGNASLIVVDVRPESDFEAFHIAGSINIPAYQVPVKGFLKSRQVVLVNRAYTLEKTQGLAERLIEEGFPEVSVLQDGIEGYAFHGGAMTYGEGGERELHAVPVEDFVHHLNDFGIVDFTEQSRLLIRSNEINAHIPEEAMQRPLDKPRSLIVADEDVDAYELALSFQESTSNFTYFLRGDVGQVVAQLEMLDNAPRPIHMIRIDSQGNRHKTDCLDCP